MTSILPPLPCDALAMFSDAWPNFYPDRPALYVSLAPLLQPQEVPNEKDVGQTPA